MNENPSSSPSENEIDLLALLVNACKAIGRGIAIAVKGIGTGIMACIGFCVRHFFWLLGGTVSGLLIIILFGRLSEKMYVTGEAMLTCIGTPLQDIETEIHKLNQVILAKNAAVLASENMLDTDISLIQSLRNLSFGFGMDIDNDTAVDFVEYNKAKAKNIYTEKTLKGGSNGDRIVKEPVQQKVPGLFFLKMETEVTALSDFHALGQAVCAYLNRLPQLQSQLHLQRLEWEARIAEIETQKSLLDSLLRIEYFENSRLKAASFAQGSDKLTLSDYKKNGSPIDYEDLINLTDEQARLETMLAKTRQVVTIQSNFVPVPASLRVKKVWVGLIWVGIFIVSALIYDFRKPIGQYIRQQRQK
ncbi:MAG: hypothetical protein K2O01_04335 [Bacteroidales bacterium]|nr:hypothetical protein [Bacteroidales bacterium]